MQSAEHGAAPRKPGEHLAGPLLLWTPTFPASARQGNLASPCPPAPLGPRTAHRVTRGGHLTGRSRCGQHHGGLSRRYHWKCTAASAPGHPCFAASSPHGLDTGAPALSFPAGSLSDCCDQFLVTLTVSSGGRNSSDAQVFLSTRPDPALRCVLPRAPTMRPQGAPFRALTCWEPGPQEIPAAQEKRGSLGRAGGPRGPLAPGQSPPGYCGHLGVQAGRPHIRARGRA